MNFDNYFLITMRSTEVQLVLVGQQCMALRYFVRRCSRLIGVGLFKLSAAFLACCLPENHDACDSVHVGFSCHRWPIQPTGLTDSLLPFCLPVPDHRNLKHKQNTSHLFLSHKTKFVLNSACAEHTNIELVIFSVAQMSYYFDQHWRECVK